MPKAGYYAVRTGRVPGVYLSWTDCEAQVKGFAGALYKKLSTEAEANDFVAARAQTSSASCDIIPASSTSRPVVVPEPNVPSTTVRAALSTPQDEKDCDIVYCDGACKGNGQVGSIAGIGVWWGHGDPRNISERCPGDQTNNRAELIAIVRILETTPRLKRRLLIKTDSKYSIQCVSSWIFKWMKNGFVSADGKPVKNRALIKYLAALLHVRRKTSQTIELKHVRGHVGVEGNEAADQLANLGATKPMVPERDWEKLEKQVLQSSEPVKSVQTVHDGLKAYADGLLSDDELIELVDTSVDDIALPAQRPRRQHSGNGKYVTQGHTSASLGPPEASPLPINATGLLAVRPSVGTIAVRSKILQSVPPEETTLSKKEVEAFASCLLGDSELSSLGKDGVFDSDF